MDAIDELFDTPVEAPPKIKMMPRQLLGNCALNKHKFCRGFGWVNTDEFKTNSNAGNKLKVRCSCACHLDEFDK
jgi:hypothetical protein